MAKPAVVRRAAGGPGICRNTSRLSEDKRQVAAVAFGGRLSSRLAHGRPETPKLTA